MKIEFKRFEDSPKIDGRFKLEFDNDGTKYYSKKYLISFPRYNLIVNNKVVGSLMYEFTNEYYGVDAIKIYCLEIFKPYRGLGYGKLILREVERFAIENKLSHIYLDVKTTNHTAYNLYKKYGFKVLFVNNDFEECYMVRKVRKRLPNQCHLTHF